MGEKNLPVNEEGLQSPDLPISILYVDDEEGLLILGKIFLERGGAFRVDTMTSAKEALKSPHLQVYDVIVSDYQMPGMDGLTFLKTIRDQYGAIPFILFTGRGREEVVIEALNSGADFYLQKGGDPTSQFAELANMIRRSVSQRRSDKSLLESEEKFRVLAETAPVAIIVYQDSRYVYINEHTSRVTGYSRDELYSMNFWEILHPDSQEQAKSRGFARMRGEEVSSRYDVKYVTKSGEIRWADLTAGTIQYQGKPAVIILLVGITERKAMEDELRAAYEQLAAADEELQVQFEELKENRNKIFHSEQEFRSIIENLDGAYYRTDEQGNLIMISPSFAEQFGYSGAAEIIGKNIRDNFYLNSSDRDEFLTKLKTDGKIRDTRVILRRSDGSPVVVSVSGHQLWDPSGNPVGTEGIVHDISDTVRIEEALRKSEEQFREMAERSSDLIIILNHSMSPTYVSPSARAIIGYDPEELVGKPPEFAASTIFSQSGPDLFRGVRMTMSGVVVENIEVQVCRKDGTLIVVNLSAVPTIHEGVVDGVQVSMRDITRAKKMEMALKESEEKFRSFVENANEIVFSLAPDGTFTYVSPNWIEQLGHSPGEVMGRSSAEFIHPDDLPKNREIFIRAIKEEKKGAGIEYRIRHKNGTWRWHSQSLTPVHDTDGKVIAVQGICHDITERKKSEEALRKANRQLGLLSSITRHDILNKISIIYGFVGIMERELTDPSMAEYLRIMNTATRDIQTQIEFTRVYEELGSGDPQWILLDSVFPLSPLPSSVILTTDIQGISIFADPMLEKVFFNLLDNSIRHGETVSRIRISTREEGDDLIVVWEDNGVGISEEEKEKIFDRGFGKNTGLGMFLVREILFLTDIMITENGIPGEGARFEMRVPRESYRIKRAG